jgi:subtilisin family serine protease
VAPAQGHGVKVAVVDTGIDAQLPALAGTVIDQTPPGQRDQSADSHGTEVAELIAGTAAGQTAAAGLAPRAELIDIQVTSDENRATADDIVSGITRAVAAGARVINISLGTQVPPGGPAYQRIERAVNAAISRGSLVVASVGSATVGPDGQGARYPADTPGVIAVAATDQGMAPGQLAGHGQYAVFAPGDGLAVTDKHGDYVGLSGNDFAAAYVSAAAALIWSAHPALSESRLARLLVTDTNPAASATAAQRGVLDPLKVLQALGQPPGGGRWHGVPPWLVVLVAVLALLALGVVLSRAWRSLRLPSSAGGRRRYLPFDWDLEPR